MSFPLPERLMKCKRCGGKLCATILDPTRRRSTKTYMVICRACDVAAVAPQAIEPYLDELKANDETNAQLRILR